MINRTTVLSAFLSMSLAGVAGADEDQGRVQAVLINTAKNPVKISACLVAKTAETETDNAKIWEAANYANSSARVVKAVRIRFRYYNPFGELVYTSYGTHEAALPPGGAVGDSHWEKIGDMEVPDGKAGWVFVNIHANVSKVKCNIDTVLFSNGAKWEAHT